MHYISVKSKMFNQLNTQIMISNYNKVTFVTRGVISQTHPKSSPRFFFFNYMK